MEEFMGGLVARFQPGWAVYNPANVRGAKGLLPGYVLAPHAGAQDGGQDAAGTLATPPGGTSVSVMGVGTAFAGTMPSVEPQDWSSIVTALIVRNVMDVLRDDALILQQGSFIRATHVPGTNQLRYTAFGDLGAAVDLLEGIPPQPEGLAWDTQEFTGKQKGKLVAITDLAETFSPFELYRIAAEKLAWNAVDTAEKDAVALVTLANVGLGGAVTPVVGKAAENIVLATVAMKQADVPPFPDGTYHCFVSPADAAKVMTQVGEMGWTDTVKYANGKALLNGELGTFRGVRFIESNRIPNGKSVIFGPDAFIWGDYQTIRAYRVAPGGDHSDPLAQRGLLGWKGMWGLKLNEFTPTAPLVLGPASNPTAKRWMQVNLV